jgi:hypothetical protein
MPERRQAQRTITLICAVADRKLHKPVVAPIGGSARVTQEQG